MNKVKKISAVLVVIMLSACLAIDKAYAALQCSISLSTTKNKVTYEEQFSVYGAISDLDAPHGIIAIGAVISYDKESLILDSIEGQNNWTDPYYNPSNGKITMFKNELSKKNEQVFKITFKVKEKGKAKDSAWVKISNFEISDGEEEKQCGENSITIKIENQDSSNTGNGSQGNNTQKPDTKPGNNHPNTDNTSAEKPGNETAGSGNETSKPAENVFTNSQTVNATNKTTANTGSQSDTNNANDKDNDKENDKENETGKDSETDSKQNVDKEHVEKAKESESMSKMLLYIIGGIAVIAVVGILFVIVKRRKSE